jgi:hypothetical protein
MEQSAILKAYESRPDLQATFYSPTSGGYAKDQTKSPGWNINKWAEQYGVKEMPELFGSFNATIPDSITTKDASAAVTAPPLPTDIQNGINGPVVNPEATGVISDMAGSNTSNFQGRLDQSATYNSLSAESSATMAALRQVLSQPNPVLDETQAKEQQKALADAQGIYKDKLKELNDEELRIKQQWGVGPIWRGRLALFNSEKSLMLEPLQVQVDFLSGQYDKALERAQQMFENSVNLQENKISKLSALNTMITGQLSREEENMWKQYQIDEENRLNTLKREQDLQDQKVQLAMKGYVFDPTSTWDEITKTVGGQEAGRRALEDSYTRAQTAKLIADANDTGDGTDNNKALSEVASDVTTALSSDYTTKFKTREELINALGFAYPELTREQIGKIVYGLISDQKEADLRGYKLSTGTTATSSKTTIPSISPDIIQDELSNYLFKSNITLDKEGKASVK